MGEAVRAVDVLGSLEVFDWFEVAHFARDTALIVRHIEMSDRPDAADAGSKILPKGPKITAHRRDNSHSSDDNSARIAHKGGYVNRERGGWQMETPARP